MPEKTSGPFPLDEQFDRRDVTEGYPGQPMRLGLRVLDETVPGAGRQGRDLAHRRDGRLLGVRRQRWRQGRGPRHDVPSRNADRRRRRHRRVPHHLSRLVFGSSGAHPPSRISTTRPC
jgi:hypothetical protein